MDSFEQIVRIVRAAHRAPEGFVPLHAPVFGGNEGAYVQQTIDSTFVSSVGAFVDRFEAMLRDITGAACAVATVNGTAALHAALRLAGVEPGDLVLTQTLSFAATCNAVAYCGASPAFADVDADTLGLSPDALRDFLETNCERAGGQVREKASGRRVAACVPMHTFGHPCRIEAIAEICAAWGIPLVEDAAESLGSASGGRHTGTFGLMGTLSFNGNKIVTCGGGGAILTNDEALGRRAKHVTTTAKVPHRWLYRHDELGFNYRLPNLNAALGCAQLERLPGFLADKRALASEYAEAFKGLPLAFVDAREGTTPNFWLNALFLEDRDQRDAFLEFSNDSGVMTRPVWEPLHTLPMYAQAPRGPLDISLDIADRLVNIPSSFRNITP
ncbi:LegC family aminotransferase [Fundidesulfovibrio agrisoli]|uniref:LegC family aminotransferase n=1 Tax=Fundidesulfovibrio agrisoli TaxID=2922717 RepID=UPI001FADE484|nr:LegC family aminotransferase [Fundidesulfovibrio agrisoli]